jgi:hypothetical protein
MWGDWPVLPRKKGLAAATAQRFSSSNHPAINRNSGPLPNNPVPTPDNCTAFRVDDLVKSRKCPKNVIPVNTGIQKFQRVTKILDTGFHRCDDF